MTDVYAAAENTYALLRLFESFALQYWSVEEDDASSEVHASSSYNRGRVYLDIRYGFKERLDDNF